MSLVESWSLNQTTTVEVAHPGVQGVPGAVDSVNGRAGPVMLTSADVGLGNVNNTSDASKPVSTAQAAADSAVLASANATTAAHAARTDNPHTVTAAQVGADPSGTAASAVAGHVSAADPHPGYALDADLTAGLATKLNLTGGTLSGWLKMAVGSGHYLYNLDTDASNYERLSIGWASNTLKINAEAAGTGTLRNLGLQTAGGYVGIGTASPTHGLHVSNGGNLSTMLVYNPDPGVYTRLAVRSAKATSGGGSTDAPFVVMDTAGSIVSYIRQDGGVYSNWLASSDNATVAIGVQEGSIYGLALVNDGRIEWSGGSAWYQAKDLVLLRDAANTLGQRNGLNAQTFRLYNTYTDASNYERGFLRWASNALEIGTEYAGTGTYRDTKIRAGAAVITLSAGTYATTIPGDMVFQQFYLGNVGGGVSLLNGSATTGAFLQFTEQTAPAAPATNDVRIYAEDNGAGKTRLMAHFATGAAVQVAIEP